MMTKTTLNTGSIVPIPSAPKSKLKTPNLRIRISNEEFFTSWPHRYKVELIHVTNKIKGHWVFSYLLFMLFHFFSNCIALPWEIADENKHYKLIIKAILGVSFLCRSWWLNSQGCSFKVLDSYWINETKWKRDGPIQDLNYSTYIHSQFLEQLNTCAFIRLYA